MKQENRRRVLSLISRHPLSRSALAKETALTQSAISSIINELLTENIVTEIGKSEEEAALGRKPIALDINPAWGFIVAISIDHEGFEVGLLNLKGLVLGEVKHLPYVDNVPLALDAIAQAAEALIREVDVDPLRILGVGAITPGPVDAAAGRILNPPSFEKWHGVHLKQELQRRLPYRVYIQHNSNALAQAEYGMGAGMKYSSFALLAINAGIGMGLVLDGEVYNGPNGFGCEIGHTSIDVNGRLCTCGNRGCLELYASTAAVLYDARRTRKDICCWQDLVDMAYREDRFCDELLDVQAKYIAHSIINLNNLLELDAVILTGSVSYRGEYLLEKIRRHVYAGILSKGVRSLTVEFSSIRENTMVVAAGSIVIGQLFYGDLFAQIVGDSLQELA